MKAWTVRGGNPRNILLRSSYIEKEGGREEGSTAPSTSAASSIERGGKVAVHLFVQSTNHVWQLLIALDVHGDGESILDMYTVHNMHVASTRCMFAYPKLNYCT